MYVAAVHPIQRRSRRDDAFMVPRPVAGEPGRFIVDATWGTITPMVLAPGVRTVGELEVIAHIDAGLPLIDTRLRAYLETGTLPTARSIPHNEIAARLQEISPETTTVLFCNGPQCLATPDAIQTLLRAGHPPGQLRYYRGGIHDWMTLGLPLTHGRAGGAAGPAGGESRLGSDDDQERQHGGDDHEGDQQRQPDGDVLGPIGE